MSQWQEINHRLSQVLGLELKPVAISRLDKKEAQLSPGKVRICKALLDVASGASQVVGRDNNGCFGAAWHLGFNKITDKKILGMIKQFVVEGEKLFSSYDALDNLISQMEKVPLQDNLVVSLAPLGETKNKPEIVVFVCNPEEACRLLTLATFSDGLMPKIKIGGPTCRLAIIYPLLTGNLNISFYDYTARKICNVPKDKLLVSAPYPKVEEMAQNLDKCSGGTAKIEYPQKFREFLQQRLKK